MNNNVTQQLVPTGRDLYCDLINNCHSRRSWKRFLLSEANKIRLIDLISG